MKINEVRLEEFADNSGLGDTDILDLMVRFVDVETFAKVMDQIEAGFGASDENEHETEHEFVLWMLKRSLKPKKPKPVSELLTKNEL